MAKITGHSDLSINGERFVMRICDVRLCSRVLLDGQADEPHFYLSGDEPVYCPGGHTRFRRNAPAPLPTDAE